MLLLLLVPITFGCAESELPVLFELPNAELVDSGGNPVPVPSGRTTVYDFIFTRCGATCPMLTANMKDLTIRLDDEKIDFHSVTVDPLYDTPPVLAEYREEVTDDPRWRFLTGEREVIEEVVEGGFRLGISTAEDPREPILHSSRFVLVDREGRIRGYYDALDPEARDRLVEDVESLARE